MRFHPQPRQGLALIAGIIVSLPLLIGQGCPVPGPGGSSLELSVTSPSFTRSAVVGDLVTVVYDAVSLTGDTLSISAFYDRDGVASTGDEQVFATGLASGTGKFTQLATTGLEAGTIYLGITASDSQTTRTVYAPGSVTLVALPSVTFSAPARDFTIGAGVSIPVLFDAGEGVGSYDWTLFYDSDGVFNNDETVIQTGTSGAGEAVETEWDTSFVSVGVYYIGARITSPDGATDTGYASGAIVLTSGPYAEILAPSTSVEVVAGSTVAIVVAAGDGSGGDPEVRLFYDPDTVVDNGNGIEIETILASDGGTLWDTAGVVPDTYYIGAEILDVTPTTVGYSVGKVTVLGTGSVVGGGGATGTEALTMRSPMKAQTLFEGEQFEVRWTTNLTVGEATIEVFREPDIDGDGVPDGESRRDVISEEGLDASEGSLIFDTTGVRGTYFLGATVTPLGGEPVTDYAEGTLTIVPALFWVGHLRTLRLDEAPSAISEFMEGAVFRGHNFGDNLGSDMLVADDYDGDGIPEVVMAAQFGKPFFFAQDGRGAGEAYLIYGQRAQRYLGNYDVNTIGAGSLPQGSDELPGLILTGIIPNPNYPNTRAGLAGTSVPYTVDGEPAGPYSTEGLRAMLLIPDQDGDGKMEIVFGFPYCNSYSLAYQMSDGIHPAPLPALGRLENNGHFLRGGLVILASINPMLTDREETSRHYDRVLMLHEVGQVFSDMTVGTEAPRPGWIEHPTTLDYCPRCGPGGDISSADLVVFPGEGFFQSTQLQMSFPIFDLPYSTSGMGMDPPRLATPYAWWLGQPDEAPMISAQARDLISLSQIDAPPGPTDEYFIGARLYNGGCEGASVDGDGNPIPPWGRFPSGGTVYVPGTGFYYDQLPDLGDISCDAPINPYVLYCPSERFSTAREPYGCRVVGQTTSQPLAATPTTADRFGHSFAMSGEFLMIGAPNHSAAKADVTALRLDPNLGSRSDSGTVYMLQMKRPGVSDSVNPWSQTGTTPAPYNYVIQDLGYTRCDTSYLQPGDIAFEMTRPFHIIGQAGERIGDVTGLLDMNSDGVEDFAVGGAGTNGDRGAVYVIYRRQPEIEADYLLERLKLAPTDLDRLNGLMILGREGEELGTAIAGVGPDRELNDDYNNDGYPDLLIGSPNVTSGNGFESGETFILFGGENLLSPANGVTIPELRDAGYGMVLAGAHEGDRSGTVVMPAGDVNRDGIADLMIVAPDASPWFDSDEDGTLDAIGLDYNGDLQADDLDGDGTPDDMEGSGLVYLVFGGEHLTGTIGLDQIGTQNLPGVVFVGRKGGDHLGGGLTQDGLLSKGVNSAGDLDGDGYDDLFLSSVLADPDGKTDAGEVYLVYGFTTPIEPRGMDVD